VLKGDDDADEVPENLTFRKNRAIVPGFDWVTLLRRIGHRHSPLWDFGEKE